MKSKKISKAQALELLHEMMYSGRGIVSGRKLSLVELQLIRYSYEALESQPCEDTVSCNYTTEEIAKSFIEDVESVKDQLDGQTSEDCISRQALLDILEKPMNWTDSEAELQEQRDYGGFVELLKSMPSVIPSRPRGEWIPILGKRGARLTCRCSVCLGSPYHGVESKFCPNCGADMRESEDEE